MHVEIQILPSLINFVLLFVKSTVESTKQQIMHPANVFLLLILIKMFKVITFDHIRVRER